LADVYGDGDDAPTVLLWHGMQADARAVLRPLAGLLAGYGATVVAPDWNSHAADGGRSDLLGSVDFARAHGGGDGIVLIGWSMGGLAAAGLTMNADRLEVPVLHTVCLAGAFMAPDPISGRPVGDGLSPEQVGAPFMLLHGLADDVVPVAASRDFAARLDGIGWPVELVELEADHGSIAGADHDPDADRYSAAQTGTPLRVAGEVAARIAAIFAP
jgi:dipeptidyl aminopeptidase/acylaminoacyl peptidase